MAAETTDVDYTSPTVPPGALFVAADEPLIFFPSVAIAEAELEAIDVTNGVYPVAYGPKGEHFQIQTDGDRFSIERTGEPNKPDELRALLIQYLEAIDEPFEEASTTSALVDQVWQLE